MAKLLLPTNPGGDFPTLRAGSYLAICDMVVFLGLQEGTGAFPKARVQLYVRFEIPSQRAKWEKDGKQFDQPAVIGNFYTASMNHKSTLRKHLESWRGRQFTELEAGAFDVATILGRPCMISVTQSPGDGGKTYSNLAGVAAIPREFGAQKLVAELPLILYTPEASESYNLLPEWLRKKIDNQILEQPPASGPDPGEPRSGPDGWDGAMPDYDTIARQTEITDDDIPFS